MQIKKGSELSHQNDRSGHSAIADAFYFHPNNYKGRRLFSVPYKTEALARTASELVSQEAGLQQVPGCLMEASEETEGGHCPCRIEEDHVLDGAGVVTEFRYVVQPVGMYAASELWKQTFKSMDEARVAVRAVLK